MNWTRLALITIGAGIMTSLTDWLFAGDWLHRRYTYQEIWRQGTEAKAIALTAPLPFLTCAVFAFVMSRAGFHSVSSALKMAVAVWVIAHCLLFSPSHQYAAWMKLHRVFVVSYAASWLVKLAIIAVAAGWFL